MLSGKASCCFDWTLRIISTKAYAYLDKNKSLVHLDTKIRIQFWHKNQPNDQSLS